MNVKEFKPFAGQHCETTATGCLLNQLGIELSEPMLFGLGEGLGYIFWNMKSMDFPFIGGRIKPDLLTANICRNLNLTLNVQQTASTKKAWENVVRLIDADTPVGLKLDCFHLDYFSTPIHFAGHYVALYGYDDEVAYLIDTDQQGGQVTTSLDSLARARSEKGPMSSKNLSYWISGAVEPDELADVVVTAIWNNATDYLNPPITNISYKGILKTSREIKKWFASSNHIKRDFQTTSMLMERAGTGGALFRNLYRDFLLEAHELTSLAELKKASIALDRIATLWSTVADCFFDAGESADVQFIQKASELLVDISSREESVMTDLRDACSGPRRCPTVAKGPSDSGRIQRTSKT
ncbi:MAG: BtrH N-terminal domain-containing protein [Pirellulaceae bacterium]|nr:BtrH N-terminal domain-containing protein [Pirellulaceae bacterium]